MKETDLYPPVKQLLESQGYEVKGEVHDCDVVAVRADEMPVIVELKRTLSLSVVLQAVGRLSISGYVYIGIPQQSKSLRSKKKHIIKMLRMLGLGLMLIDNKKKRGGVNIILDPGDYRPRRSEHRKQRMLGEFNKRVGDPNSGGSSKRRGVMTAYRQRAINIAHFLNEHGASKASRIAQILDEPKARVILYKDVYGWFDRVSRGVYDLSPRGSREFYEWSSESSGESLNR